MDILVVGGGAREHALVWKLKQSPKIKNIFVAPGNAGTLKLANSLPISKTDEIVDWLKGNKVDLVVVGPDSHLAEGIVDKLQELNIPVFGPTKNSAEIEWSKAFAKDFMRTNNIPTAKYEIFNDIDKAKEYIKNISFPVVIKASGLALGKGVVVAQTFQEAEITLDKIMKNKVFGNAGDEVIIEEFLRGIEISTHAFCDGVDAIMFPSSQDHKRIFENDKGPNTGGMGTIAPVPGITEELLQEIKEKIVLPTLGGLKKMGRPFKGILFPGIMLTDDGPKVIEFNARFGDPETQSYMRILETDLVDILLACVDGALSKQKINWSKKFACCVVVASGGYPGDYENDKVVFGLENIKDCDVEVFHGGTKTDGTNIFTNGGRVLSITATGDSLQESLTKAYKTTEAVYFDGMQYRKDIGRKSL